MQKLKKSSEIYSRNRSTKWIW